MGKKSGADPDVASGVRLIGKLRGIIYYMLLMVKQSVGRGHPTALGQWGSKKLGQYRIILSADTASEVRQMLSQKRR